MPKYLNSPETPDLHEGTDALRPGRDERGHSEAQLLCAGRGVFRPGAGVAGRGPAGRGLVGTALTAAQARILKRFTSKVVLSFDPDAAGQGAAARSSELLVAEGFQVNVALLPEGSDPDTFIREVGRPGVCGAADGVTAVPRVPAGSRRGRAGPEPRRRSRKRFLDEMLAVAATIPDAADRDQFADRLAHKARITETVVRDEIRQAAAERRTEAPAVAVPAVGAAAAAEQGLLWALAHRPVEGLAAVAQLEPRRSRRAWSPGPCCRLAASLAEVPAGRVAGAAAGAAERRRAGVVRARGAPDARRRRQRIA